MKRISRLKFVFVAVLTTLTIALRFYKIGNIPEGLSLEEVELGLRISGFLDTIILSDEIVRIPWVLSGILSIALFFLVVRKYSDSFWFAFISALILCISPWHIQESRIMSLPILLTNFLILALLFIEKGFFLKHSRNILTFSLLMSFMLFFIALLDIDPLSKIKVDQYRTAVMDTESNLPIPLFTNKYIESYRLNLSRLFEGLDFGYYFFSGHPRERWGNEESPKLFIIYLPFLLIGFAKLSKKQISLLISYSLLVLILYLFVRSRGSGLFFPLIFPMVLLIAQGIWNLVNKRSSLLKGMVLLFLLFELTVFLKNYFSGYSESFFSPRNTYIKRVVAAAGGSLGESEKVIVSEKLPNSDKYFQFYLKNGKLEKYEFRDFNIWKEENKNFLYVDVIPHEITPESVHFGKEKLIDDELNILHVFPDDRNNQDIVIYRYE